MASGKKGKRTKGITIPLTDFLQESGGSLPSQPIRKSTQSWADEIDNDVVDPKTVNMVLPTAPKASRDYDDIANNVPKEPPFMAYLSNLPYDVDEDEIADFFRNMKILKMNIPKEDRSDTPKLKGYGYVEFEDRESLMAALIIPDTTLKNRRIRIEVASNTDNDRRRGGGRQGMGDRMGGSDTGGDWRSTNRPDPVDDRRGEGRFSRDREGGGGAFTREGMREAGSGRDRDFGGFNRDREGGGFNRDRDGGGFNRDREGGFNRDREGGFNRDREGGFNRDSGFNRNRDQDDKPGAWRDGDRDRGGFSRPSYRDSERNRDDRDDRRRDDRDDRRGGGFRRYDDKDERNGGFTRSSNRGDKDDRDTESHSSENRQRPKLQLAPRTKPLEPAAKDEPAVPSASIFGSAKPVDTTERERQVEEKLLKEQEERLTETTRDKKEKDKSGDEGGEKKSFERGRPLARKEDRDSESHTDMEVNSRDRGPPQRDRNVSGEDNRKPVPPRSENKSPDKKKVEKTDKEKKVKSEVEMPKFQDPEPPNFQGSNKFALLDDNSD